MSADVPVAPSRRAAGAFLVALLVAACGGTPASPAAEAGRSIAAPPADWTFASAFPRSEDYAPPAPDSAWSRAVERVGEDGLPDRDSALRLFALAVGPLPGVDATSDGNPVPSATFAMRAVRAHWDELTSEQRAAIEAASELPADAVRIEIPPVTASSTRGTVRLAALRLPGAITGTGPAAAEPSNHPYVEELVKELRSAGSWVRSAIVARMGGDDIPGPIDIALAPCGAAQDREAGGQAALGCAEPRYGAKPPGTLWGAGPYVGCQVRITGDALSGGAALVVNTLAHEIFHCFQFDGYGTAARFVTAPSWVVEGGAEWVGNEVTGELAETDHTYDRWFTVPGDSLLVRTYSAVGFWGHLAESGKNPYDVFQFVWLAADGPAAFRSSSAADNATFLDSWASSVTREIDRGRDWDTEGAGIPGRDVRTAPEPWSVANGSSVEIHAEPYTVRVFELDVSADVLRIGGSGHARISDGTIDSTTFPATFCARDGGCDPCPGQPGVPISKLAGKPYFAVTGGIEGATYTVVGEAVDATCPTPTPTPTVTPTPPDDAFCDRVRALMAWTANPTEEELSQGWARYIHDAAVDMREVAPPEMVPHVDVLIEVYGIYAGAPEPYNVPMVGPAAVRLGTAIPAILDHCGIRQ